MHNYNHWFFFLNYFHTYVELILTKNFISTTMLPMSLLMFFFFSIVCAWLGSVDSLVNRDLEIHHLKKVVSRGVNKAIMEHLVKLYREIVLGYILPAYDSRKSLCTIGPLPFPSKEFQINLLGEDDDNNTQRFLNQIPQK
jgi:hypothetical protein